SAFTGRGSGAAVVVFSTSGFGGSDFGGSDFGGSAAATVPAVSEVSMALSVVGGVSVVSIFSVVDGPCAAAADAAAVCASRAFFLSRFLSFFDDDVVSAVAWTACSALSPCG